MTAALIVQNQVDYINCLALGSQRYAHVMYSQRYIYKGYIQQPQI